ncbi:unnamed protein product, partial [Ectocarpus fasciculatus]
VGLDLIVHPGAHLTVQAPTVSVARTEAKAMQDHPVLLVLGSVEFKVTTWLAQPLDDNNNTAVSTQSESYVRPDLFFRMDNRGTVWLGAQGSVRSDNEIVYTATSVIVSADKVHPHLASSEEPAFHTSDPETSSAAADSNDRDGDKNVAADDANPSAS